MLITISNEINEIIPNKYILYDYFPKRKFNWWNSAQI